MHSFRFLFVCFAISHEGRRLQTSSVQSKRRYAASQATLKPLDVYSNLDSDVEVQQSWSKGALNIEDSLNASTTIALLSLVVNLAAAFTAPGKHLLKAKRRSAVGVHCADLCLPTVNRAPLRQNSEVCMCNMEQPDGDASMDWREVRARLVQQYRNEEKGKSQKEDGGSGYVYESPLIEKGSIILGGTQQNFGFALKQQYFHKCVMLLLEHDKDFSKGIILNRPSAIEIDGWRVWFGGDVAEGGLFNPGKIRDRFRLREIICLHALEGKIANRLSRPIIKGIAYTTLDRAKLLVATGAAQQSDFWVFVGFAGWGPQQLQGEVDRGSWFLASADSETILQELLTQGKGLPAPSTGTLPENGLATWEALMTSIGRSDEVLRTRGSLDDRMLNEWCRIRLAPRKKAEAFGVQTIGNFLRSVLSPDLRTEQPVTIGTVLRTGLPSDRSVLSDQFLHKSLLLTVDQLPTGGIIAVVLNRPTAQVVRLNLADQPSRCVNYGGRNDQGAFAMEAYFGKLMWLTSGLGIGREIGDSGLRRATFEEVLESIKTGLVTQTSLSDWLLVTGSVRFEKEELSSMFKNGELHIVEEPKSVWPQVFELADSSRLQEDMQNNGGVSLSDGTGVWWLAALFEKEQFVGLPTMPPTPVADDALAEWLKIFAGH